MSISLLSVANDSFCLRLQRAARLWRQVADEELKKYGLSEATTTPLWLIGRLGEGLRQRALAEHLGIEGQSLVRLIDHLESSGLVVRRDDPTDRRAKVLMLTEAGKTMAAQVDQVVRDIRERLLQDVSAEALHITDLTLDAISRAADRIRE
ncbi:MarR family winged helix-turn-helix transcriptional regulator [Chromobacterium violaceum]|uniref:MarR family transcriptional regulator n=2 Tax=Chromobacterium violaceum TaxID=536 RepID=A0A202B8A9_CHRVL|nr:MarR family transcriptional regulator [Chromobacterium violaceum]AAQ59484.1 probable transcriptional regulator, marR family [Chromobacterium violaceum ATCC 12472]ATP28416.1 MarR family transcriptional regulator [Chromobacterium violaceum]ATP32325.1 MarR family transcriptional regulator [Chromobacterium violaceum]KJH67076.1 MarR family transcriptional regulator [Chromobacterium violaceum]MBA8735057.1 MarR family transcriptional regulator [Chromobacterium violaceum]